MHLSVVKAILFSIYASINLCNSEKTTNLPKNVSVSTLIAFGDSFVDQGNNNYIKTLLKADFPPYGKDFRGGKPTGRFSNGKTIADILAEALGVKEYLPAYLDPSLRAKDLLSGVSFASGGTGYDPLTPKISSVIPLSVQLDNFKRYIRELKRNIGEEAAQNLITKSVFLVVGSTNDLVINYFALPIRRLQYDVPAYDNKLVKLALNFVQEIYKLGARKIAVFGAPPIGCTPIVRTTTGGAFRRCQDKENNAAQLFNSMLKQQLQVLASSLPQSSLAFVDVYNPLITAIENPNQYGLEVTDKGCCGTGTIEVSGLCNKLSPTCYNDSKFLFWDSIHPSEEGNKILVNHILPDLVHSLF
ncbi:hypothetical protein L6452_08209 [Arctium lappa]|uniref:Uncharacterized protein n=1 Tax=Arctium lappa TaxID=4217 RepID=A0ACB9DGZ7_ARCLA|nr:hypothetical protein L6452_08209 [Arctium lappa]